MGEEAELALDQAHDDWGAERGPQPTLKGKRMSTAPAPAAAPQASKPSVPTMKKAAKAPAAAPLQPDAKERPRLSNEEPCWMPPKIVLSAVEGWGKTSAGAFAPSPAILMSKGETGYETLLSAGLVPQVPRVELEEWSHTLETIEELAHDNKGIETVVFDAIGGFERQCHEMVCRRDFAGDWGEKGFTSYQKGYDVALRDWLVFLARLEWLQNAANVTVVLLSHIKISTFKNPVGPDYDRWVSDVHHKTWGQTAKWADCVLFGNFVTVVEDVKVTKTSSKGKGKGGTQRVVYTERRDAWDAKNRYGMAESIDIPDDASQTWDTIWNAMFGE